MAVVVDKNVDFGTGSTTLKVLHPSSTSARSAISQSFTCSETIKLLSAKFHVKKVGSPVGMVHAVLYEHSGTYGSNSKPTGPPLATSDDFDVSTLPTSYGWVTFNFTEEEQYEMQADTHYCIVFENPTTGTINSSNYTGMKIDAISPTHSGNMSSFSNSAWASYGYDIVFYVYGEGEEEPPVVWDWRCNHETPARRAFESSVKGYIGANLCWGHTARDTFFVGKDGIYRFKTIEILYSTTEICSYSDTGSECSPADCYAGSLGGKYYPPSWPREGGMWCSTHGCPPHNGDGGTDTPWYVYVETSMDGTDWEIVGKAPFGWVKASQQQTITLDDWKTFRFIRIRQPDDKGGKSLAGFLDSAGFNLPDLEKVEDEGDLTVKEGLQCDATNSIDGIPIPDVGQKFLGMPYLRGVTRDEEEKICGDMGSTLDCKYFWSSGNEVVTWFAGWKKKWIVDRLEGNIKICRFRTSDKICFVVQTSMDGTTWKTITETDLVSPDGEYTLTLKGDEPFEFRFLRIFIKPHKWWAGSIFNAWIQDAVITQLLPEICDWIDSKGGPGALTESDVYEIVDAYSSNSYPPDEGKWGFVPTLKNVFGVLDYFLGFDGDLLTGCDYSP